MNSTPQFLNYFGTEPRTESMVARAVRLLGNLVVLVIFIVIVTLRAACLLAGFTCVFAGTLLLTLGGKRSAAVTLSRWRNRALELLKLWWGDVTRPLRRRHAVPVPVLMP